VRIFVLLLSLFFFPGMVMAEEEESAAAAVEYLEMTPKFTVNLEGRKTYLLVNVQLLVEGAENIEKIKKHFPALRHQLIMLYSGRPADELKTAEQREKLRKETLNTLRETLEKLSNGDGLRDVFFTEFLVQ
jgi:flagellar protein FliL